MDLPGATDNKERMARETQVTTSYQHDDDNVSVTQLTSLCFIKFKLFKIQNNLNSWFCFEKRSSIQSFNCKMILINLLRNFVLKNFKLKSNGNSQHAEMLKENILKKNEFFNYTKNFLPGRSIANWKEPLNFWQNF